MKTLLLTIALVCTINAKAQSEAPGILWNKDFESSSSDFNSDEIIQLQDSNFLVLGNVFVDGIVSPELSKLSPTGTVLWQKQYANVAGYYAFGLKADSSGNIFLLYEGSEGVEDRIGKLNSNGEQQWLKSISVESYPTYIYGINVLSDNSLLVCGTYEMGETSGGYFYAKYDSNGNQTWIMKKSFTGFPIAYIGNVMPHSDGGVVVLGGSFDADYSEAGYIAKYDSQRNLVWEKYLDYTSSEDTYIQNSIISANNDIVIFGNYYIDDNETSFVTKLNSAGNEVWRKTFTYNDYNVNQSKIIEFSPNEYTIATELSSLTDNGSTANIKKITSDGNIAWEHSYDNEIFNGLVNFSDIIKTNDNNLLLLTKKYMDEAMITSKYSLYKMGGSLAVKDVAQTKVTIYPNPTSDFINIKLEEKENLNQLEIFDLSGKLIKTYENPTKSISVKDLSKGSYLIKLYFGNQIITQKIIKN
ncbi:T9SS type A sorting domain-containing protein [Soonwooa sp.]|uniref:T9SS type A sorting domain-containing protein n=1 Tax=Soonwooa sp. TaxID=1938592 RepID=UPI0035B0C6B1